MNTINLPEPDVGNCILLFECQTEQGVALASLSCPVRIAEDVYYAVTMEMSLTQDLTDQKFRKIVAEAAKDVYTTTGVININLQRH